MSVKMTKYQFVNNFQEVYTKTNGGKVLEVYDFARIEKKRACAVGKTDKVK